MTHICASKLTIIGSDNGLSPCRRQVIIWTNAGILLIRSLGTNFSEILSEIHAFSFKKIHLKMSSAKWRPFCLGLNVLSNSSLVPNRGEAITLNQARTSSVMHISLTGLNWPETDAYFSISLEWLSGLYLYLEVVVYDIRVNSLKYTGYNTYQMLTFVNDDTSIFSVSILKYIFDYFVNRLAASYSNMEYAIQCAVI